MTQNAEKLLPQWLLLTLIALVLWGFWAFIPKLAMTQMSIPSVIFYEGLGNLCVALPVFIFLRGRVVVKKQGIALVGISGAIGMAALFCYYYALKIGSVATVATITALYPIVVLFLARVFLNERLNRVQLMAVGMAMVAIGLLASG